MLLANGKALAHRRPKLGLDLDLLIAMKRTQKRVTDNNKAATLAVDVAVTGLCDASIRDSHGQAQHTLCFGSLGEWKL